MSSISTATGRCVRLASWSACSRRSWKLRWLKRPVRESVRAWCSSRARICALSSASAAASEKRLASSNSASSNDAFLADAIDVEHALDLRPGDQRDRDQRLRVDRRPGHEPHARVEVGLVDECRLAALAAQPVMPSSNRIVVCMISSTHWSRASTGVSTRLRLVGLVDRERVVRDQLVERVGDPHEQCVEALLREDFVEDVGKPPIRIDELRRRRGQWRIFGQEPQMRGWPHNHLVLASWPRTPPNPPGEGTLQRWVKRLMTRELARI